MNRNQPIVVVSMAGIFPGAPNLETFWQNLIHGRSAAGPVPRHRWIAPVETMVAIKGNEPDRAYSGRACLIEEHRFDPDGFLLPASLLAGLDPVHQLALDTARQAWYACGRDKVNPERVATILAAIALPTDASSRLTRELFLEGVAPSAQQALSARVTGLPAALVARCLGLGGGSLTLDAACASSLYAVKLACDALHSGRADAVVTGGVSRPDCLFTQVGFSQLQALSPSGRCAPFDRDADGLVVGEGAGILVLRRLDDALACGDTVYGLIRGIGLSNDMRGNLLAPDSEGQLRAMRAAYAQSGWTPDQVDLVECHGTGTPVGDAVELKSLAELWRELAWHPGQCAIGSVKSAIGHLLTGAGAASLIKTLMGIHRATLPPSLNFTQPAPGSALAHGPFRVPSSAEPWSRRPDNAPRRAAVSAFGFGGINAHLLVEEWTGDNVPGSGVRGQGLESKDRNPRIETPGSSAPETVAVVGLAARFGPLASLDEFQEALFTGRPVLGPAPTNRWRGRDELLAGILGAAPPEGAYLDALRIAPGQFRIPPKELPDILLQHLLALQISAEALADAGLPQRQPRPAVGVVVGMEFDMEASDFHLRWYSAAMAEAWGLAPDALASFQDRCGPPLTAPRTTGALGGLIASRIAREFGFGAPSFTVSNDSASGLRALEIARNLLLSGEADTMLVCAVDLPGDLRRLVQAGADAPRPGEGAAALVLKRTDRAEADGDRVYAKIRGVGTACGNGIDTPGPSEDAWARSLDAALTDARTNFDQVGFLSLQGSGSSFWDRTEPAALARYTSINGRKPAGECVLGSAAPLIGHTGAVAGLASFLAACLALNGNTLPPLSLDAGAAENPSLPRPFSVLGRSRPWPAPADGLRSAVSSAASDDGTCMHVVLEESGPKAAENASSPEAGSLKRRVRNRPDPPGTLVRTPGGPPLPPHPAADPVAASTVESSSMAPPESVRDDAPAFSALAAGFGKTAAATAQAHERFLDLSRQMAGDYARAFDLQTRLMGQGMVPEPPSPISPAERQCQAPRTEKPADKGPEPVFDRAMCMEFAVGSVGKMLGPDFAVADTFARRVRLPDEPLMLVDRITAIEGEPLSLGSGRVGTEHDVLPGAWYLDGDRAPVCIAVEAGQADLFLCAYLGIDHQVRGQRSYRLLDAKVVFHRGLPRSGETIRYDIRIDRFVRQDRTWLFFFRFEGTVDGSPLITMTDGCAGFFTPEEVERSGGILLTEEERSPAPGHCPPDWAPPVPVEACALDETALEALRRGDAAAGFGPVFAGVVLPEAQRLPGGRMKLIDRVVALDPAGGRFGLGQVQAEADIHSDDWFLTCHFMDDMVMPGTLMYECCAHTLRVFFQRLGWVSDNPAAGFEPVPGVAAVLKCRGPVTPETKIVEYAVEIKELGYGPEPYVIADALMSADGRPIVRFQDMSMRLAGVDRPAVEAFWEKKRNRNAPASRPGPPLYDYRQILAFSVGDPSEAFGEPYRVFDRERRIARLPGPPYLFMNRVTVTEPDPWALRPGGWIEAEYDVPPDAWYFMADRSGHMPFCVLLEIALQPCGWLAAYLGSALRSPIDLKFRNLGGSAELLEPVGPRTGRLTMAARLTRVSEAAR